MKYPYACEWLKTKAVQVFNFTNLIKKYKIKNNYDLFIVLGTN